MPKEGTRFGVTPPTLTIELHRKFVEEEKNGVSHDARLIHSPKKKSKKKNMKKKK